MRNNGLQGKGRRPHEDAPYQRGPLMRTTPIASTGSSEFKIGRFSSLNLDTPLAKPKSRNKKSKVPRRERTFVPQGHLVEDCSRKKSSFDYTGEWTAGLNEPGQAQHSMNSFSQSRLWSQPNSYPTHKHSGGQEGGFYEVYSTIPEISSATSHTTANVDYGFEFQHQSLRQQDFRIAPTSVRSDQSSFQIHPSMIQQIPHYERGYTSENVISYPLAPQQFEALSSSAPGYYPQPSHYDYDCNNALSDQTLGFSMPGSSPSEFGVNRIPNPASLASQTPCSIYYHASSGLNERASFTSSTQNSPKPSLLSNPFLHRPPEGENGPNYFKF